MFSYIRVFLKCAFNLILLHNFNLQIPTNRHQNNRYSPDSNQIKSQHDEVTAEIRRKFEKRNDHHHQHHQQQHHVRPHSEQVDQQQIRKTKRAVSENTGLRHQDLKIDGELKTGDVDEGVLMRRRRRMSSESTSTKRANNSSF